jgi:molybdenum cofactor cytidylyltransferase
MNCAIVLAAGRSRRMGAPKLVLPFAGSTVVARVVDAMLGAPVDAVVVVIRPGDTRVRGALVARCVVFVENPEPEGDMLSSVRCGLRALPSAAEAVLVSPGDQPSLKPGLIREMLLAFRANDRGILVPVHRGRRGHPLVFAARFREELLTSHDGTGLRGLLQTHPADVLEWPTPDAVVLEDLDTPDDYRKAMRDLPGPIPDLPTEGGASTASAP